MFVNVEGVFVIAEGVSVVGEVIGGARRISAGSMGVTDRWEPQIKRLDWDSLDDAASDRSPQSGLGLQE